jgi:hypothetical protein
MGVARATSDPMGRAITSPDIVTMTEPTLDLPLLDLAVGVPVDLTALPL